jgi:LacI family transcriptional regulator
MPTTTPRSRSAYLRVLMEKRIDGLILVASGADDELSSLLSAQPVPIVLVDREVDGVDADFIEADHEKAATWRPNT